MTGERGLDAAAALRTRFVVGERGFGAVVVGDVGWEVLLLFNRRVAGS